MPFLFHWHCTGLLLPLLLCCAVLFVQVLAHFVNMPVDPDHAKPMLQRYVPNAWDWELHRKIKGDQIYVASTPKVRRFAWFAWQLRRCCMLLPGVMDRRGGAGTLGALDVRTPAGLRAGSWIADRTVLCCARTTRVYTPAPAMMLAPPNHPWCPPPSPTHAPTCKLADLLMRALLHPLDIDLLLKIPIPKLLALHPSVPLHLLESAQDYQKLIKALGQVRPTMHQARSKAMGDH